MHDPDRYRPTERFGDRVDDYRRYRPGYPGALTRWLIAEAVLDAGDAVADIGAGTGLLTRDLLAAGLHARAVEPNAPMRAAAEADLGHYPGFSSVDGTAEATTLAAASVKLVTAAQAYHWFQPEAARAESIRILVPGGHAALIWNVRRIDSRFAEAYETLLMARCPDYAAGQPHQASVADIARYFGPATTRHVDFDYQQHFDFEGLKGRLLSSSYTPKPGDPAREPLCDALRTLFDQYQQDGQVAFGYDTRAWIAQLKV
ncbi:methyltransferase domain-containing protein [Nevskia sp.]|uniref:class I SAM-dependent methyltransferase n=1 Tax=Nevskia sp. TaxID=1929292 RepID=UPI0025FB14CD|nr:methyltransferase domain-containing protein [Nevskia sp.]